MYFIYMPSNAFRHFSDIKSWSWENNFCYHEIPRKISRYLEKTTSVILRSEKKERKPFWTSVQSTIFRSQLKQHFFDRFERYYSLGMVQCQRISDVFPAWIELTLVVLFTNTFAYFSACYLDTNTLSGVLSWWLYKLVMFPECTHLAFALFCKRLLCVPWQLSKIQ